MSPQTAPETFRPSHLKWMVALPVPDATLTGSASETRLPPNVTSGLPVFSLPVTRLTVTSRSYRPMVTIFLTVPLCLTLMFSSSSVTWSTKPDVTLWTRSRASVVGTPTLTGVCGIPSMRGSLATRSFEPLAEGVALLLEGDDLRAQRLGRRAVLPAAGGRGGERGGEHGEDGADAQGRHLSLSGGRRAARLHEVAGLEVHGDPEPSLPGHHLRHGDLEGHPGPVDPDRALGHRGQVDALLHLDRDLDRGQLVLDPQADHPSHFVQGGAAQDLLDSRRLLDGDVVDRDSRLQGGGRGVHADVDEGAEDPDRGREVRASRGG